MSEQEKPPAARRPKLRVAAERQDYEGTFALDPEKPEERAQLMTRVRHHPDAEVRYLAAALLRGEPVLAEIALGDPDPRVRRAAILHLGDADLWALAPILAGERADTLAGEALLARPVLSHRRPEIRLQALLKKRWDREPLALRLLESESDHETAARALREVHDRDALRRLADALPTAALRAAAARRIAVIDELRARSKPPGGNRPGDGGTGPRRGR